MALESRRKGEAKVSTRVVAMVIATVAMIAAACGGSDGAASGEGAPDLREVLSAHHVACIRA